RDGGEGRADPRPRYRDDRAAGRGDEGNGQRVQRGRARAALGDVEARPQKARGHLVLPVPLDPGIETLVADEGRLRQLLHNLLTNATEALEGRRGGEIAVRTLLSGPSGGRAG